MIKYILWDLDGTIMESGPGVTGSVRYALDKMNVSLPESELRKFIGPSLYDSFTHTAHMSDEDALQAIEYYREVYETTGLFDANVYEGIPEVMQNLMDAGYKHVVVTSKPLRMAKRVIEHFEIDSYLDNVIGPAPDDPSSDKAKLIAAALDHFGADPDEAIMIGDRKYDIEGAVACGVHSIGVLYGYGGREELLEAGAEHLTEVPGDIASFVGEFILDYE